MDSHGNKTDGEYPAVAHINIYKRTLTRKYLFYPSTDTGLKHLIDQF